MFRAVALALVTMVGAAQAPRPQMAVQLGHTSTAAHVAVTPDGRFALSAGGDAVILWDLATGAELRTFPTHGGGVDAMALRRDGKVLACGNLQGALWLVDVERGTELRSFAGHRNTVSAVALSPDGSLLASVGSDQTLRLWDTATGENTRTFQDGSQLEAVAISPDGRWLAAAGILKEVRLWSLPELTEKPSLKGHEYMVDTLAFSPDSTLLASGGDDKTVRLWDLATQKELQVHREPGTRVNALAFSPDGRLLAAASGQYPEVTYATRLWDVATGREERVLQGRANSMACVTFTPDGRRLVTGRRLGLQIWDPSTGAELLTLMGHASSVRSVQFSPDGRYLATAQNDATARLWDLAQGAEARVFRGHEITVTSVAFSPDGKTLATSSYDHTARLWDLATGAVKETLKGHGSLVDRVAFSADGRFLFTSSLDRTVRRWKASGGSPRTFQGGESLTLAVAVSPDGKNLATLGRDKTVVVRDADSGKERRRLEHPADVEAVAFSPNGAFLLAGCQDHQAYLWDVGSGRQVRTFKLDSTVGAVAFTRDGARLGLGGWAGDVAVFDARTGGTVCALRDQTGEVSSLAFSPDGSRFASAGWDGAAHIRETATGRELAKFFSLDKGWVVVTPEGYFDGSPEGLQAIRWTVGLQSFPLEAFSEGYYVPALLPRVLAGERLARLGDVSQGFKLPPSVRIAAPAGGASLAEGDVEVRVEASDQGGGIDEIRLYLNGKAVEREVRGVKVAGGAQRTEVFRVALVDGENRLRAVALSSARIESNPSEITVSYKGPAARAALHVLAVGIDHYKNGAMDLNFARADAGAVAAFFTSAPPGLFRKVEASPLYDAQATKAAILAGLEAFRALPPQDVAVIYLAGHGEVLDNTWYFLPYELTYPEQDEEVRAKGLSSRELQEAVRNIGAQKILVLLDACKSGEAMRTFAGRGVEDRKALANLARATGVHIVAATTKDQLATEVKELGHGVFTYTLLMGLKGGAMENGQVSVLRLMAYVGSHLPEVSEKYRAQAQYPVLNSQGMDFPLAAGP